MLTILRIINLYTNIDIIDFGDNKEHLDVQNTAVAICTDGVKTAHIFGSYKDLHEFAKRNNNKFKGKIKKVGLKYEIED